MEWDFIISISCLVGAIGLGLRLAVYNYKNLVETHDIRMEIYRHNKRLKNERLRRALGLPKSGDVSAPREPREREIEM